MNGVVSAGRAAAELGGLFPAIGPWTSAALWFGRGRAATPPGTPLRDELDVLVAQRLAGLTLAYIKEVGAEVPSADESVLRQSAFAWTVLTQTALLRAPAEFAGGNGAVRHAVSKGPGIARLYPRPELRPFSDIDVILAEPDFSPCVDALAARGWYEELRNQQPWNSFRRYCREGLNLMSDDGGRVDLHHRFPPWLWSVGIDTPSLLQRAVDVSAGGRQLRCLSDADNFLVASLHVVSDRNTPGQSLLVWRDIVELAAAATTEDIVLRAREAGLVGWIAALLRALPEPFGTENLLRALEREDAAIAHPRRLATLLSGRPARWGVVATQVLRLPVPNGILFALGMLLPSPRFLRGRYPDQTRRYRRWWRDARRARRAGELTVAS